jgi:L-aspartate oxidase
MTGVHGANRLASNSLLEAVVFGERTAIDINRYLKKNEISIPDIPSWDDSGTLTADEKILIAHNLKELKHTMWDYVSIVRSNQRLERAAKRIYTAYTEVEEFYKRTKIFPDILELRNLIACAHIIIKSARMRKESRGLHYTIDYPETDIKAVYSQIQNTNP